MNTIVKHYSGSIAYGTNLPESDVDFRGIFCAEPEQVRTPFFPVREIVIPDEEDSKLYELSNYMKLYCDGNPNIVESLWVADKHIVTTTPAYELLKAHRQALLSKKIKHTFTGYAFAQLKRIKGHNKWIENPQPDALPVASSYVRMVHNFTPDKIMPDRWKATDYAEGHTLIPYGNDLYGVVEGGNMFNRDGSIHKVSLTDVEDVQKKNLPKFLVKFVRDYYKRDKELHTNYWRWVENRNEKRAALEAEHGYDCYSADTEFLTEDGWKLFDEVSDSKLATFNKDHEIEYYDPIAKIDSLYTGDLYQFSGQHQDTLVTANHHMYTRPYSRNLKKTSGEWSGTAACQLPESYEILNVITPKSTVYSLPTLDTGGLEFSQYLRLMGWFLSDGTISFRDGKPKDLRISQSKKGSILTQVMSRLRNSGEMPCNHFTHEREGRLTENIWSFSRSIASAMYSDCGHGSSAKRIPNWVFKLSKRSMDIILTALIQGDGTKKNQEDTYVYYSTNSGLADDVQRLSFLCGYKASKWGPHQSTTSFGDCTAYQVHIDKSPADTRINTKSNLEVYPVENYRVVCFEVPNNTLVTRRNGKISLHKNCKHAMHLVRLLRMGKETLETGEVLVARPDCKELLEIRAGKLTYEELLDYAVEMDDEIEAAYEKSDLPRKPDIRLAAKLTMDVQDLLWN